MAIPTAQQLVANWQAGMARAGAKYQAGINAVQDSPMAKAASAQSLQKYAMNTQAASVPGGRMETGLNAVSLQQWKTQATGVGATNLVSGAQKGAPKLAAKANQLISAYQSAKSAAQAVQGTSAKVMASINAMRSAFGKGPLS